MVSSSSIQESFPATSSSLDDDTKEKRSLGARIYSHWTLKIYDFWVLGISNSYAWRCPTSSILLPFFKANFSSNHLDVGVGTGYFPAAAVSNQSATSEADPNEIQRITLVDLNPNCLSAAAGRIGAAEPTLPVRAFVADAFEPLPLQSGNNEAGKDEAVGRERFDSISLFYLLHCLPGPCAAKARIFENLKTHLTEEGALYGTTILGQGENIRFNWFGRALMWIYNQKGVFDNCGDTEKLFIEALEKNFEEVEAKVVGCVLLFKAWKART